jgi:hypothetical protein
MSKEDRDCFPERTEARRSARIPDLEIPRTNRKMERPGGMEWQHRFPERTGRRAGRAKWAGVTTSPNEQKGGSAASPNEPEHVGIPAAVSPNEPNVGVSFLVRRER